MGTKSSYQVGGVVLGLPSRWILCVAATAACAVGSAPVLVKTNPSRNVWITAIKGHRFPVTGLG